LEELNAAKAQIAEILKIAQDAGATLEIHSSIDIKLKVPQS
jgi:histidinol phosphatase-like PHP family hydrolase